MAVFRDGSPIVTVLVGFEELRGQVIDQLCDLFLLPLVFALVVVDRIFTVASASSGDELWLPS
jgi:hypothetical protein